MWVNDLMIFAKDKVTINDVKSKLNESFDIKDLGELEYFLGIQVNQDQTKNMIKIDQETYIEKFYKCKECKTASPYLHHWILALNCARTHWSLKMQRKHDDISRLSDN